jgi:hypothetical protein
MRLLLESKPLRIESMTLFFDNERLLLEREPTEPPCMTTPGRAAPRAVVVGRLYSWEKLHQMHWVSRLEGPT